MKKSTIIIISLSVFIVSTLLSVNIVSNKIVGPPVIIYKTKKNYDKNVAVILSDDKTSIVSYPDPKDIIKENNYCYPTHLKKGFLLDNRGINKNVAFLSITYEEYAKYKTTPSLQELQKMIIDKNPLKVMYSCGTRYDYKNLVEELNQKIQKGCKNCIKIK